MPQLTRSAPRRSRRHAPPSSLERIAVPFLAALAAGGAMQADAHPTGWDVSDLVLTGGFAAALVAAGSVARRWTWAWVAGGAVALLSGPLLLVGVALEVVALGALLVDVPARRVVGAVIAAGAAQLVLRLPEGPFFGFSAVAVGAVTAPLLVSGWRLSRRSVRRRLLLGAQAVLVLAGVAGVAFAVAAVETHDRVEAGTRLAHAGLRAARAGDVESAARDLGRAAAAFDDASRLTDAWWVAPARALPVAGQHAEALDRLVGLGEPIAADAALVASTADVGNLRIVGGTVDVDLLSSMAEPLANLRGTLTGAGDAFARVRSPWLAPVVAARVDAFERQIDDARRDVEVAAEAATVLPTFLGRDRPHRYFVILGTPAETRDLGGFMGNYSELTVDRGHVTLTRSGGMQELNQAGQGRQLTDPAAFPDRYRSQRPERFWQNVTGTPDLPTVAEAVRQMWPQSGGGPLDGVLYLDPHGIAALLQLTGPVVMAEHGITLEPDTAADLLLRGQYLSFASDAERKDFLLDAAETVFEELTAGALPGPRRLADLLGPAAHGRHLMLHSFDRPADRFLERVGVDGSLPPVGDGDFVALTSANLGPSKLDAYVRRGIDYDVRYDPSTGRMDATARITLDNTAPPEASAPSVSGRNQSRSPGTAALELAWYTPLQLAGARLDGHQAPAGANQEYGRWAYRVAVEIPPGGRRVVELDLRGDLAGARPYELTVVPQPAAHPDTFTLSVDVPEGWEGDSERRLTLGREAEITIRSSRP